MGLEERKRVFTDLVRRGKVPPKFGFQQSFGSVRCPGAKSKGDVIERAIYCTRLLCSFNNSIKIVQIEKDDYDEVSQKMFHWSISAMTEINKRYRKPRLLDLGENKPQFKTCTCGWRR